MSEFTDEVDGLRAAAQQFRQTVQDGTFFQQEPELQARAILALLGSTDKALEAARMLEDLYTANLALTTEVATLKAEATAEAFDQAMKRTAGVSSARH